MTKLKDRSEVDTFAAEVLALLEDFNPTIGDSITIDGSLDGCFKTEVVIANSEAGQPIEIEIKHGFITGHEDYKPGLHTTGSVADLMRLGEDWKESTYSIRALDMHTTEYPDCWTKIVNALERAEKAMEQNSTKSAKAVIQDKFSKAKKRS